MLPYDLSFTHRDLPFSAESINQLTSSRELDSTVRDFLSFLSIFNAIPVLFAALIPLGFVLQI